MKDVSRFRNRDIRRVVLLDPKPLTFMICPENGMPVIAYNAEFDSKEEYGEKESYLLGLTELIKDMVNLDDVRPYLNERYGVRQKLKLAKLIWRHFI